VIVYATDVHGDEADVYARDEGVHPLVLLLHGSHAHRRHYYRFAWVLAAQGFVVLVPSHTRELFGEAAYYPEQSQAGWAVEWARAENLRTKSPLRGRINADSFFVVGHSFGGAVALGIATKNLVVYLNEQPVDFPDELKAVAAIGTHNVPPRGSEPMPVANKVPLAMVQGTIDGTVRYEQAAATFAVVQQLPKLFVTLEGANHYPVTNDDDPIDANTDHAFAHAELDQELANSTVAVWLSMWFAANDGDEDAIRQLRAATNDPSTTPAHVTIALVESQDVESQDVE
jgi:predicted dienelactone hydrolase